MPLNIQIVKRSLPKTTSTMYQIGKPTTTARHQLVDLYLLTFQKCHRR